MNNHSVTSFNLCLIIAVLCILLVAACEKNGEIEDEADENPYSTFNIEFFRNLGSLCGEALEGRTEYPTESGHELRNAKLKFNFTTCADDTIEIDFYINDVNRNTFLIQVLEDQNLALKLIHKQVDGLNEVADSYGGIAGDEHILKKSFYANEETARLHPQAFSNVWAFEIDLDNRKLIYRLTRQERIRFKGVFELPASFEATI